MIPIADYFNYQSKILLKINIADLIYIVIKTVFSMSSWTKERSTNGLICPDDGRQFQARTEFESGHIFN